MPIDQLSLDKLELVKNYQKSVDMLNFAIENLEYDFAKRDYIYITKKYITPTVLSQVKDLILLDYNSQIDYLANQIQNLLFPPIDVSDINITIDDENVDVNAYFEFEDTLLSTTSSVHTFTISNPLARPLNLNGSPVLQLTGINASEFTILTQPDKIVLNQGETTSFTVIFSPQNIGTRKAKILIPCDAFKEEEFTILIKGVCLVNP